MCGCASRDSIAAYAVPAAACDASITLMPVDGRSRGLTFVQVLPLSRVRWARALAAPAQITPALSRDSPSDWVDPPPEYQSLGRISPKSVRLGTQAVPESCWGPHTWYGKS